MAEENTKNKKHLLHVFPSFGIGGVELRTCSMINSFGNKYRHTIIAMNDCYKAKEMLRKDIDIKFIRLKYNKKNTIRNIFLFRKILKKIKPDLLLTCNWGSIDWAIANFFRIVPHIHSECGFHHDESVSQKKRRIYLRRIFLSQVSRIVVPSLALQRIALETWKLGKDKVVYIPSGINFEKFAKRAKKTKDDNQILIGALSTLSKVKNIPRMLRVFSSLPINIDAKLLIAGGGPESGNITHIINERNLKNIEMLGHLTDPSEFLDKLDIFFLSSDSEQMPCAVLEAMAAELPIISTDVGDVKEMVCKPNREYIIDKKNERELMLALKKLIENKKERIDIGMQNQKKCKKYYSGEKMVKEYQKLYKKNIIS